MRVRNNSLRRAELRSGAESGGSDALPRECRKEMNTRKTHSGSRRGVLVPAVAGLVVLALGGCTGIPTSDEKRAREDLDEVRAIYRPGGGKPSLPLLDGNATLGTLLTYAILNQPKVEAAYHDYAASVQRITVERSLPDPRLTLELDIQDVVMTLMPGLMVEMPRFRRLRIRADEASAESRAKGFAFESAVLRSAYEVKKPFYQLRFLEDRIVIQRETLHLLYELEQSARARVAAGRDTLQDVLRAQMEQERLKTEIENLEDSRNPLVAQLKAALGKAANEPNPPVPKEFESTPLDLSPDQILNMALVRNPRLKQMEAEVWMAEAGIRMAHQSRLPDIALGLEADVKASPTMWRPSLGATLPVWRDRIGAEIAAAQALKSAAQARLNAEQVQLAVEIADKSFVYRESTRSLSLLNESLLPKARQSLQIARASYATGRTDFIDVQDAGRSLLEFRLAQADARIRRELALSELSLLVIGVMPPQAPVPGAAQETDRIK